MWDIFWVIWGVEFQGVFDFHIMYKVKSKSSYVKALSFL